MVPAKDGFLIDDADIGGGKKFFHILKQERVVEGSVLTVSPADNPHMHQVVSQSHQCDIVLFECVLRFRSPGRSAFFCQGRSGIGRILSAGFFRNPFREAGNGTAGSGYHKRNGEHTGQRQRRQQKGTYKSSYFHCKAFPIKGTGVFPVPAESGDDGI